MQVTKNFHSRELECKDCCGGLVYDERAMELFQTLRTIMGVPFIVLSFYRCRFKNDITPGAAKDSRHLYGAAMDIKTEGWSGALKWKLLYEATKLGLSVGWYRAYTHLDYRPTGPVAFP